MTIGSKVKHSKYPSMLYDNVGTIVANAGTKYKRQYWTVEYRGANGQLVRTDFWDFVLKGI